jgi:hypothetical protein
MAAATCNAEIYKWVDESGQTHFSERKDSAGAKAIEPRGESPTMLPQTPGSSAQYWREQEWQFRERQEHKRMQEQFWGPQTEKAPKSLSGGTKKWADNDVWRCNLARDIISGAVKHPLGNPITPYDIKLAQENVRAFCH